MQRNILLITYLTY